ncbi:Bug family tripartite tricarboxylate transporter substrate binding protein [Noviherbaspirillum massiliense]|uniref:Bug family tripartite tricarboxylate transporter substrate binding protein n=1 Tax=Noviherbaspirillum massiliense TaxID=1465823 RepID=UPI0002E6838E|nr:tripartite tricarboxylate transporter substrate binding protein BugE [Noviherbaspirillum massiliense]
MSKPSALRRIVLTGLACSLLPLSAFAQDAYPTKPITLIVPFVPGGSTDLTARLVAKFAGQELGQTIIVENRAGAGGSIGMAQVARAKPDGYTIGMATVSTHGSNPAVYPKLAYDAVKDFTPITNVAAVPSVFSVHPSVPAKTMKEFIALARANPGKYTFASPGHGSLGHVNIENLTMQLNIQLLHVPYKGAGQALTDATSGQVNAITDNLSSSLPFIKSGKLRPLAVLSATRSPDLPDVPTYAELGTDMKEAGWFGIVGPAGMPADVVKRLNQAIHKGMQAPEFKQRLAEMGGTPVPNTPEQFQAQIKQAVARYSEVAKKAKIQLD